MNSSETTIVLRQPTSSDGAAVHALIDRCKPLDLNSCYAYLLLCAHFSETCVLAEMDGEVVGFLSGYLIPDRTDTVFVWQVAVDKAARGQGLGGRMLDELLSRQACRDIAYLDTTISPSNEPSQRLFRKLAMRREAECRESTFFTEEMLGGGHEEEVLFHIGPLK